MAINMTLFLYFCCVLHSRLQKLLKHISIRRLKFDQDEGKPLVKLPPRTVVIQEIELSGEERELYDAMQNHGQLIIGRLESFKPFCQERLQSKQAQD